VAPNGNEQGADPELYRTRYLYDKNNRLVMEVRPLDYAVTGPDTKEVRGAVIEYGYSAEGRVLTRIDRANTISLAGLASNPTVDDVRLRLANSPNDSLDRSVYDRDGRMRFKLDALGSLTEVRYDGSGNVSETIAYGTPLPGNVIPEVYEGLKQLVANQNPSFANPAKDHHVRHVYDAANRETYTIDDTFHVVERKYDGNGNVTDVIAHWNAIDSGTTVDYDHVTLALDLLQPNVQTAHSRNVYDAAGRLTLAVDAAGGAVERKYDANGNVTDIIRYATPVAANLLVISAPDKDEHDKLYYDHANRRTFRMNGLGEIERNEYDRNGNVVQQRTYDLRLLEAFPNLTQLPRDDNEMQGQLYFVTSRIENRFEYDGANRLTYSMGAAGDVARREYDAQGNVVRMRQFTTDGRSLVTLDSVTPTVDDRVTFKIYDATNRVVFEMDAVRWVKEYVYDAKGNLVSTIAYNLKFSSSALDLTRSFLSLAPYRESARIERSVFDSGNRRIFSVDAMNYVTRFEYDGLGRVYRTTVYANSISPNAVSQGAIEAALAGNPVARQETFAYDTMDRLVESTDGAGNVESFTYDALGRKRTFANKNRAVWTYDYDAAGRLTKETSPSVRTAVASSGAGDTIAVSLGDAAPETATQYDGIGRVIRRIEAGRVTEYAYDAAGRQLKTTFPEVQVFDNAQDHVGMDHRTDHLVAGGLYAEVKYNARGEAVVNRSAAGVYTYRVYDLGRLVYEVDGEGYVTKHEYTIFGDSKATTRFANPITLRADRTIPWTKSEVTAALGSSPARAVTTSFDKLGRPVRVTEPSAWVFDPKAVLEQDRKYTGQETTDTFYNAWGEVSSVGSALDKTVDGAWNFATFYYGANGRKSAEVDALGYATTFSYYATGELKETIEYATALAWDPKNPATTQPVPAASAKDRVTRYEYDGAGRKIKETRVQAETGVGTKEDIVTTYGYDSVGNLTRTTDDHGASTFTYYDALGRVVAVAAPTRTDLVTNTVSTPITLFDVDAHGNVVKTTEFSVTYPGATDATAYFDAPAFEASRSQVVRLYMGALGRNPDIGGLTTHLRSIAAGTTMATLGQQFVDSVEFGNRFGTNLSDTDFVAQLYRLVLGREPSAGSDGWVTVLQNQAMTRGQVLLAFTNSVEYSWKATPAAVNNAVVAMLRDAVPFAAADKRSTYALFDAHGHATQRADASGHSTFASYDELGNLRKEWENAGSQAIVKKYAYDSSGARS
jgi:YD repeat-containing protein